MSSAGSDTESTTLNPTIGTSRRRKGGVLDTRRAEQNRAAQRAFRQRKERYVKELENKVRDLQLVQERANKLEEENERLRQRVWELEKQHHHPQQGMMHHHHHPSPPQPSLAPPHPPAKTTHAHPMQTTHPSPPLSSSAPPPPPPSRSISSSQTPSPPPVMRHSPIPARTLPPPSSFTSREEQSPIRRVDRVVGHSEHYHHHPTAPMEKGRVLDDLITILRTHHRPPIPARLSDPPIES
ncbi:hypothetical protein K492DRAFT_177450 [Lichtheimia hyalospora FSU 10163]|nr:hypothetical protein K492DRAFT_177450 [Lichtheimia hyalospora FSU 10163]